MTVFSHTLIYFVCVLSTIRSVPGVVHEAEKCQTYVKNGISAAASWTSGTHFFASAHDFLEGQIG